MVRVDTKIGHEGTSGYKDASKGGVIAYTQAWGHEDLCLGICNDLHPNHLVKFPLPNFWFSVLVQCTYHLWTQVSMWRYMHPWFLYLHHLWMQEDFFFLTAGTVWVSPSPLTDGDFSRISHKRGRRLSRGCQHMILTKFKKKKTIWNWEHFWPWEVMPIRGAPLDTPLSNFLHHLSRIHIRAKLSYLAPCHLIKC